MLALGENVVVPCKAEQLVFETTCDSIFLYTRVGDVEMAYERKLLLISASPGILVGWMDGFRVFIFGPIFKNHWRMAENFR